MNRFKLFYVLPIVLLSYSAAMLASVVRQPAVISDGSELHQALRADDFDRAEQLVTACRLQEYSNLFREDSRGITPQALIQSIMGLPGQSEQNVRRFEDMLSIAFGLSMFTQGLNHNSDNRREI